MDAPSYSDDMADAPDLALLLDLDEDGMGQWAVAFLRKRGWTVIPPRQERRELPGQTTVEEQIAEVE